MIKLVLFDIDGTLMTERVNVAPTTKTAIRQLQAKGILCGIATGRGPKHLMRPISRLPLDAFVTYNGQLVYTKNKCIRANAFSQDVLWQLIQFAEQNQRKMLFGSQDRLIGSTVMKWGQQAWLKSLSHLLPKKVPEVVFSLFKRSLNFSTKPIRYPHAAILRAPIYQCVLLSQEDEQEMLQQKLANCTFTRSNPYTVDIIPKGNSKLIGIQSLANELKIDLKEIMVFGDSWNDAEMIQGAGIGVAMQNAPFAVRKLADYVTASNEQNGIIQALKHYRLL